MEAEDILQQAWENIIKQEKLKKYDPKKISFYGYLKNIVRYEILHYFDRLYKKFRIKGENHRLVIISETDFTDDDFSKKDNILEDRLSMVFYRRLIEHNQINIDDVLALIKIFPQCGPPHQLLSFGFNRLLSHWRKKPKLISEELSDEILYNLTDLFIQDFIKEIHKENPDTSIHSLYDFFIKEYFQPLKECLHKLVVDVLSDRDDKSRYQVDLKKITGETLLMDYYTGKPEKHISDWTDKVMKRLTKLWEEANVITYVNSINKHLF